MTTLTDRYVWAVLRAVPEAQRAELERELRALVADTIDARLAAGTPAAEAERAALIELGDPERLAARYTDQNLYLIGPRLYLEWRRVLFMLLPVVPPIVGMVVLAAQLGRTFSLASAISRTSRSTSPTTCGPAPGRPTSAASMPSRSIRCRISIFRPIGGVRTDGDCRPSRKVSSFSRTSGGLAGAPILFQS